MPDLTNNPIVNATPAAPTDAGAGAAAGGASQAVGVFTTPQSLVTFAGASAAVTMVSGVLERVTKANGDYIRLGTAFAVGMLIYLISVKGTTGKDKLASFAIAVINSFVLAAAALGIGTTVTTQVNTQQPAAQQTNTQQPNAQQTSPNSK